MTEYVRAITACEMFDMKLSTFYELIRRGELPRPVRKLGRNNVWRKAALIAAVDPTRALGYNDVHEAQPAPRHPPPNKTKRQDKVLLSPGPGNAPRHMPRALARRSASPVVWEGPNPFEGHKPYPATAPPALSPPGAQSSRTRTTATCPSTTCTATSPTSRPQPDAPVFALRRKIA